MTDDLKTEAVGGLLARLEATQEENAQTLARIRRPDGTFAR